MSSGLRTDVARWLQRLVGPHNETASARKKKADTSGVR